MNLVTQCRNIVMPLLAASFAFIVTDADADEVYYYGGDYYFSKGAAEAAMRSFNAPWGVDLKLCSTDTSVNWARFNYCTDNKPGIYLTDAFYPDGYLCPLNSNPILGNRCDTEQEAIDWVKQDVFGGGCYSEIQTLLSGHYDDIPSLWTPRSYWEDDVLQFRYAHARHGPNEPPEYRTVKFAWTSCDGQSSGETWPHRLYWDTYWLCPAGYLPTQGTSASGLWPNICRAGSDSIIKLEDANASSCPSTNYPCVPATGEKLLFETDFQWNGLSFNRTYRSMHELPNDAFLSAPWTHNWNTRLKLPTTSTGSVFWRNERNDYEEFKPVSGSTTMYRPVNTLGGSLEAQADGTWLMTIGDGSLHVYDDLGRLQSIMQPDAPASTLEFGYDVNGRLETVTDALGRQLTFKYLEGQYTDPVTGTGWIPTHVDQIEDSTGAALVAYSYGPTGLLEAAIYPDGASRLYHYAETDHLCIGATEECEASWFADYLTGITTEDGLRLSDYYYDSSGRVVRSVHDDEINDTVLTYVSNTQTLVSRPNRGDELYGFDTGLYRRPLSRQSLLSDGTVAAGETWQYDTNNAWRRFTDANGVTTKTEFDSRGLEIERIEAEGLAEERSTITTWTQGSIPRRASVEVHDAAGQPVHGTNFTYNTRAQVLTRSETDPATAITRTWTYTYCEQADVDAPGSTCPILGLRKAIDGSRIDVADVTTFNYYPDTDESGCDSGGPCHRRGDLWKITNALGQVTEYIRYDRVGRPLRIRDPNGVDTVMTYHVRGWLLTQTVAGATTTYDYLPNGLVSRITQPDGSYLDFEYDGAQRLEAIENALGERIEYELDAAGNRTAERIYDDQSTLSFELQQVYDQLGRLETTLTGTGHETDYAYDAAGNLTGVTDALENTTSHEYDPLNRLKKTLDALDGETLFAYDARDNLVEVTDPEGLSTHYTYNAFDELVELDSPDTGVTTYTYDSAGNRLTQTDARSVTTTYSHDALNRLTAVQYPDSSLDVAYLYDEDDSTTGCTNSYPFGRMTRMTDPSGTTVYCYDARGTVTEKTRIVNLEPLTVGYEYDPVDRLTAVTYPSGWKVTYTRDVAGQVTSLDLSSADGQKQETLVSGIGYLPFGSVAQYTFGNQQVLERTHNLDHQITDVTSPALELHFRRDPAGNIDRLGTAPGAASPIEEYVYDDLYRLEAVQDDLAADIEAYVYDLIGNRQSKTTGAGTELYDYAATSHHLIEVDGDTRTYDTVGNLISDQAGSRTYTYGDHNRLTAFSDPGVSADYVHNGRGERAAKSVDTGTPAEQVHFVYDEAGRLLAELVQPPLGFFIAVRREYVYLGDIPVAVIDYQSGQATYYLHADHLGTPRAVTDTGGVKRWEWQFQSNPFGEVLPDEDPEKTGATFTLNLRFPGQYYDAESGLRYNYFRDYESAIGRYVQSDPIGLYGGVNTYGYVEANPLKFSDRLGLWRLDEGSEPTNPLCTLAPSMCSCDFFPDQCISLATVQRQVIQDTQCCVEKCTGKLIAKTAVGTALGELSGMFINKCLKKAISLTSALDFAEYAVCIKECNPQPGECR